MNNKAAYRKGDWKILRNPARGKTGGWELYDLAKDVSEQNDLAKQRTDKVDELLAEWKRDEATLLRVADAFQRLTDHHERRPPGA